MPGFGAVPLRPINTPSSSSVSGPSSSRGYKLGSSSASSSTTTGGGPRLSSMLVGDTSVDTSSSSAATAQYSPFGNGPFSARDSSYSSGGAMSSSRSHAVAAAAGRGVILTGGGIRRQNSTSSNGGTPRVQSFAPGRGTITSDLASSQQQESLPPQGGSSSVLVTPSPPPPPKRAVTVQQILDQHQRETEEAQAAAARRALTTTAGGGSSTTTTTTTGGGSDDLYSTALISEMKSGLAVRPVAPRRALQSTLWLVPHELLLDTFSYLDYRSLCYAGGTSSRWNMLAKNPLLWKAIATRCKIAIQPHVEPKEVVRRFILTHRAEMQQELVVVESALNNTNRRLEERLQAMPPFVAPLQEEAEAPEVRRLPTVISSAEGKMSEMNSKIESFSELQTTLSRTQRENKAAIVRAEGELKKAESLLATMKKQQKDEASIIGFESSMVRNLTSDLNELPLVLRRGLSSFFEVELLVMQTSSGGANSRLANRWSGFKKRFPIDETWMELKNKFMSSGGSSMVSLPSNQQPVSSSSGGGFAALTSRSGRSGPGSSNAPPPIKLSEKEQAVMAMVNNLLSLSPREMENYVANL